MFKSFLGEFKTFAMRGNVIDMAVGIIIGAAFGKIVNSLVADIIMPPIGLLMGNIDLTNWFFVLKDVAGHEGAYASLAQAAAAGAITLNLGIFLNAIISFIIVAFAVFLLIKGINSLENKMKADADSGKTADPTTKVCPYCYTVVPIKATRCPACTSELKEKKK